MELAGPRKVGIGAVIVFAAAAGCGREASPFELWRARNVAKGYVVIGSEPYRNPESTRLVRLLKMWERDYVRLDADSRLHSPDEEVAVVVGSLDDPASLDAFTRVDTLRFVDKGVRLGGVFVASPEEVVAFFAAAGGKPILGLLGGSKRALGGVLAAASIPGADPIFPDKPGTRIWNGDEWRAIVGRIQPNRSIVRGNIEAIASPALEDVALEKCLSLSDAALARLAAQLGPNPAELPKIRLLLFRSLQDKLIVTGSAAACEVDFLGNTVRAVAGGGLNGFDGSAVARLVAFARFGVGANIATEDGVAQLCRPAPVADESALTRAGFGATIPSLAIASFRAGKAPAILEAFDGAFVAAARKSLDETAFLKAYAEGSLGSEFLTSNKPIALPETPPAPDRVAAAMAAFPILGYDVRASESIGFAGSDVIRAFERIRQSGARDVVFTNYRHLGGSPGGAGAPAVESEIEYGAAVARAFGLRPILQTQLLGIREGGWVGEPFKLGEKDWDSYFDQLAWALAADALLAERMGCQHWILGSGLRGTTDLPETVVRWESLIARLRWLFRGAIGYMASWQPVPHAKGGQVDPKEAQPEYEIVGFWPKLDFIGVSASSPFSSWETHAAEVFTAHFGAYLDRVEKLAKKIDKPIVLGEVGASATEHGYLTPWRENGRPSLAGQEMAYRTLATGVESRPWVRGLLVSSWYVAPAPRTLSLELRSPVDRPAGEIVRRLFEVFSGR
jgi:hypothetical protein